MTNSEIDKYIYRIAWSQEGQEFVGLCAKFPGLCWLALDPDDVLNGIRSMVKNCIENTPIAGEDIPVSTFTA